MGRWVEKWEDEWQGNRDTRCRDVVPCSYKKKKGRGAMLLQNYPLLPSAESHSSESASIQCPHAPIAFHVLFLSQFPDSSTHQHQEKSRNQGGAPRLRVSEVVTHPRVVLASGQARARALCSNPWISHAALVSPRSTGEHTVPPTHSGMKDSPNLFSPMLT